MITVSLKPIREKDSDYDEVERVITQLFRKLIYVPLMKELGVNIEKLANSKGDGGSALARAIQSGRISFWQGRFTGSFDSGISKELRSYGAEWERSTKSYRLKKDALPYNVQAAISGSEDRFTRSMDRIDARLEKILPEEISEQFKIARLFDATLWRTDRELKSTLKGISVAPELTETQAARISAEWEKNLQLYIQDFTREETLKLRADLKKAVFTGQRYESAVNTIQKSYGVSRRKAKFLARQETSLLMTKFKQTRYEEAGVKEYKWGAVAGSAAHPVRPKHKHLADESLRGKLFRWDNPPNTAEDGEPARFNNPGQDYNCRCYAIPIVRFSGSSGQGKEREATQ